MDLPALKNDDPNLKDFIRIGPESYLLIPSKDAATSANSDDHKSAKSPQLTILCTWLGAPSRPIAKYVSGHRALFPGTPILLMRSVYADFTFRLPSARISRSKAAATVVKSYVDEATAAGHAPRILLHVMSNGGSWSACMLQLGYEHVCKETLPISAMVMDSAPSLPRAWLGHRAMMQSVPKFFLIRLVASILFWSVIILYYIMDQLHLHQSTVVRLRAMLNDPKGSFLRRGMPRTYICSEQDEMIPLGDVYIHASEALTALERSGVSAKEQRINVEEFTGSRHVGHMMVDARRYWAVVHETWNSV